MLTTNIVCTNFCLFISTYFININRLITHYQTTLHWVSVPAIVHLFCVVAGTDDPYKTDTPISQGTDNTYGGC